MPIVAAQRERQLSTNDAKVTKNTLHYTMEFLLLCVLRGEFCCMTFASFRPVLFSG